MPPGYVAQGKYVTEISGQRTKEPDFSGCAPAVDVDGLTRCWVQRVLQLLPVQRFAGRPVLLGDGIKIPKAGRRMPAMKLLFQPGESNTKSTYFMGHSVQVVSILVAAADSFFALPLAGRIHEGMTSTDGRYKRRCPPTALRP